MSDLKIWCIVSFLSDWSRNTILELTSWVDYKVFMVWPHDNAGKLVKRNVLNYEIYSVANPWQKIHRPCVDNWMEVAGRFLCAYRYINIFDLYQSIWICYKLSFNQYPRLVHNSSQIIPQIICTYQTCNYLNKYEVVFEWGYFHSIQSWIILDCSCVWVSRNVCGHLEAKSMFIL